VWAADRSLPAALARLASGYWWAASPPYQGVIEAIVYDVYMIVNDVLSVA
jgi:hypothetical protein